MVAKTVGSTPKESPSGYQWAATLHTTSWLSSLSVGVERRGGLGEGSEEPAWQERACMQNSRNVKQLSSTIDIYIHFMLELRTLLWHFPGMAQNDVELEIDEYYSRGIFEWQW